MERSPFPRCDERKRETCKYAPDCELLQLTEHHLRPRRLLKAARLQRESTAYLRKLKKVIYHDNNTVIAPRCDHDVLDTLTSDERIPETELDQTLMEWRYG